MTRRGAKVFTIIKVGVLKNVWEPLVCRQFTKESSKSPKLMNFSILQDRIVKSSYVFNFTSSINRAMCADVHSKLVKYMHTIGIYLRVVGHFFTRKVVSKLQKVRESNSGSQGMCGDLKGKPWSEIVLQCFQFQNWWHITYNVDFNESETLALQYTVI